MHFLRFESSRGSVSKETRELGSSACDTWSWWIIRKEVPCLLQSTKFGKLIIKSSWVGNTLNERQRVEHCLLFIEISGKNPSNSHKNVHTRTISTRACFPGSLPWCIADFTKPSRSQSCRDLAYFSRSCSSFWSSKSTVHACCWTLLIGLFLLLLLQTVAGVPIGIQSSYLTALSSTRTWSFPWNGVPRWKSLPGSRDRVTEEVFVSSGLQSIHKVFESPVTVNHYRGRYCCVVQWVGIWLFWPC